MISFEDATSYLEREVTRDGDLWIVEIDDFANKYIIQGSRDTIQCSNENGKNKPLPVVSVSASKAVCSSREIFSVIVLELIVAASKKVFMPSTILRFYYIKTHSF